MADLALMLAVFAGSFLVGYLLISRVPQMLHTPLMSMTNAISAVTILGALLLFTIDTSPLERGLGAVALVMVSFNLFGGFAITDRMLALFRARDSGGSHPHVGERPDG